MRARNTQGDSSGSQFLGPGPSSTARGASVDKFILDTWEEVDLTGKPMMVQCLKCWKMVREFFMRRRKSPMGSLIVDVECKRCHDGAKK